MRVVQAHEHLNSNLTSLRKGNGKERKKQEEKGKKER